jgi:D-glycero-beta-D-manno-heptose-7-phosphate kinase
MTNFSHKRIVDLFSQLQNKRIAIVGDVMIDKYIWGNVTRISPEAPVPVVEVESQNQRLGGAANVANNLQSLGCIPILFGTVGDDDDGRNLCKILEAQHCSAQGIVFDASRPTTVKTRVIAHNQHVVRIDSESKKNIDETIQKTLISLIEERIDSIDGIIIQDYNKGVIVKPLIDRLIELANKHKKIITVDPKFHHFFDYKNVTVFKPNKKETEDAIGAKLLSEEAVLKAGKTMLERLNAENILLTRSEKGMSIFEKNGTVTHIPTKARKVADVSGAGDTVIATLTAMLSAGATMQEAATIANSAGGIVVGEVGIVPIDKDILQAEMLSQHK